MLQSFVRPIALRADRKSPTGKRACDGEDKSSCRRNVLTWVASMRPRRTAGSHAMALAAALLLVMPACADTWICSGTNGLDVRASVFVLGDKLIVEQTLAGHRYSVLESNRHAVIAEDHFVNFDPVLNEVIVYISTLVIDKSRGRFAQITALSGSEPRVQSGFCRGYDEGAENAVSRQGGRTASRVNFD